MFKVVYLDNNNRIIDIVDAASGTVDHAIPIVRSYSRSTEVCGISICLHNHPSANIAPTTRIERLLKS